MMQRSTILNSVAAAAILLSGLPLFAQTTATAKVISDTILPRDTYMYMSLPDVKAVNQAIKSSSMGELWNDPSLDEFKEDVLDAFQNEMQDMMADFQDVSGMTFEEALALPSGEISVAISAAGNSAVGAVLFFDVGDNEARVQPLLEKAATAFSNEPDFLQANASYGGVAITGFEIQYPGEAPTPLAEEFGWFLKDGRLVASNQMELLESVIDNWDGDSEDSFVSNETYNFIMERCEADRSKALSKFYLDPIGLFTKLVQTRSLGQQANMGASMALGFLPTLGLSQMKAMGSVEMAGTGDFDMINRTVVYSEQPATGLMQVFQFGQAQTTPPNWVKNNVSTYLAANWQIGEAYTAIESLVDMFQGAGTLAGILDRMAAGGPGIHIKQDIVDNLTGQIQFITAPNSSKELGGDEVLVALGIRNPRAVADIVNSLSGGLNMESRKFQGVDLYSMEISPEQAVSLTVKDNNLLFSVGGSLMEQVLRNDSDVRPLAETKEFQSVATHFPADAVSVMFTRPVETYRSVYNLIREGNAEEFPGVEDIFAKIDFSKLPPFESLEKYIKPAGNYTIKDKNGYFTQGFQLKN